MLYNSSGAIWSSGAYGYQPSSFKIQSDGNVVLLNPTNGAVWDKGVYVGAGPILYSSCTLLANAHLNAGYYPRSDDKK